MLTSLPVLHGQDGFPTGSLSSDWAIDPTVVIVAFVVLAAYVLFTGTFNARREDADERLVSTKQRVAFIAGVVAFLVALGPPMDDWSDSYLLTAHMVQHMLLVFAVAPLWLYGLPGWVFDPLTRNRTTNRIGYTLTRPVVALVVTNVAVIAWHVPGLYNQALLSEPVHVMQHGVILAAALISWWPVLGQHPAWPRLSEPMQCLYLFLYSLPTGLVGALITFGGVPIYDYYATVPRIFGIGLDMDQQLAGLLMWVGGGTIYFLWVTRIFLAWGAREDRAETLPRRSPNHRVTTEPVQQR